jgi:ribosomal subunit interface protein
MKTEVSILHHEYPAPVREYADEKLQQLVRFFERTVSVRALLERQHNEHHAKLVASVRNGVVVEVEGRSSDSIRHALDEALARMGRVLLRHKGKLNDAHRRASRVARD